MTRQVTDQLYIEIGYHTPEAYYVYTAEAQSQQVASSTLSCDAGKITQAQATIVVTTAVSATISHIEGADLFAFSESQLAVQVDRIRDNNIETSTVFAVSTEVTRIKNLAADQVATSDIAVVNGRSRDFVLEAQAAFSFVCDAVVGSFELAIVDMVSSTAMVSDGVLTRGFLAQLDNISAVSVSETRIRDFDSTQAVSTEVSVSVEIIRSADSNLVSETALNINEQRIRYADSALASTSDISCIISHIEGADLSAFGQSVLSANGVVIADRSVSLASTSAQTTTAVKTSRTNASLLLVLTTNISPKILDDRTTFVANAGGAFSDIRIVNDQKQFGQGALFIPYRDSEVSAFSRNTFNQSEHWVVNNNTIYHIYPGSTYTSTNGTTWTRQNNNIGISNASFGKVIHTGSQFVFYVPSLTASTDTVYTSTDALTWTATTTGNFGTSTIVRHSDIVFFNGFYYVAGRQAGSSGNQPVRIWRTNSATFASWTQVFGSSFTGPNTILRLQKASNSYVALAFQSGGAGGNYAYVYRSSNGTTWDYAGPAGATGLASFNYFNIVNDSTYVVATTSAAGTQRRIYTAPLDTTTTGWTNTLLQNNEQIASVEYDGTNWAVQTFNAIYYGTSLGSLSVNQYYLNTFKDHITHFVNYNGNFIFFKNDKALYSTNGASYTEYSLPVPTNTLPGSIEYTSLTNDFQTFKTIDLWMRSAAASNDAQSMNIQIYNPAKFGDESIIFGLQNGRFTIYGFNFYLDLSQTVGTSWNHFRIGFDTATNTGRVWQNGTKPTVSDFTLPAGFNIPNAKVVFYHNGGDDLWIDEFLITDDLLTATSTTSFTPPTRQYNNSSNTDLLLHFNTDFFDDSRYAVIEQANLISTSAITANITGTQNAVVSMQVTSTATIQAQKAAEIILSAFGDSQTTANGQRVRFADSTLASTTEISAVNETVKSTGASLALDFQQSTAANITASADVTMAGTSVSLTATARVRSGDIQANVESQMVINSVITASAELQIVSTTNIAVPGERIRYADSNQQVDATTSADLTTIKRFSSELVSTSNQSVNAVKKVEAQAQIEGITISLTALSAIRQGAIDLSTQSTLTAVAVITANGVATMQAITQSSVTGIIKVDFEADLVATTQVQTDNLRVRFNDAALAIDTAQTANINYTAFGQSQQASTTAVSATATGTIDISASISSSSTLSVSANRFRNNVISAVGETALAASTNNSRTRDNQSIIVSDSQVSANVGRVRPFDAQLVANTIDLFVAAKTGVAVVDMPMFTTLQANASVIARGIVPLVAQTESTATAVKTSNVSPQLIAQTTIVAEGTTNVLAEANVAATTDLTANGSVIYRGAMSSQTTSNLTANAVARRGFAILDQSSGTMTVTGNRIRQFSSNFASISIDLIIGQKVVSFNAALVATSTLTALGRDIDLAKYVYIIPNEIRTWTIAEENRTRAIKEETRIYKIRRF